MKTNKVAYVPYVNYLTSFGGGISGKEKDISKIVNLFTTAVIIVAVIIF